MGSAPCIAVLLSAALLPRSSNRVRTCPPIACSADATFSAAAWERAAKWEEFSSFERSALLRALLDGDLSAQEANHAAWRGLGYTLNASGALCGPDGAPCDESSLPDVLGADDTWLNKMRAKLDENVEEEERGMLDTLIESLHGETLTRTLVAEGDRQFLARRTLVQWLYLSQSDLSLR